MKPDKVIEAAKRLDAQWPDWWVREDNRGGECRFCGQPAHFDMSDDGLTTFWGASHTSDCPVDTIRMAYLVQ